MQYAIPSGKTYARRTCAVFAVTAFLVAVTMPAPRRAHAYRTAEELPELSAFGASRVRWDSDTFTYEIHFANLSGVNPADAEDAVNEGLFAWHGTGCAEVTFNYTGGGAAPAPNDGRNTIGWHNTNWVGAGFPANAVAFTDLKFREQLDGTWRITEADIYLNAWDYSWRPRSGEPASAERSIRAVVAHEMGHVLGLLHPCEAGGGGGMPSCDGGVYDETLMYPLYTGPAQSACAADDLAGLCYLYGTDDCASTCADGALCTNGRCAPICGHRLCAAGMECWSDQCVPLCTGDCPARCRGAADCPVDAPECRSGLCTAAIVTLGDPCERSADCDTVLCSAGVCTTPCGMCEPGFTCPTNVGACEAVLGVFGSLCTGSEDCVSELCLTKGNGPSYCTRDCQPDADTPCPDGFRCKDVDGTSVCVERSSSGCSVGLPGRLSTTPFSAIAILALAHVLLARRLRRSR